MSVREDALAEALRRYPDREDEEFDGDSSMRRERSFFAAGAEWQAGRGETYA